MKKCKRLVSLALALITVVSAAVILQIQSFAASYSGNCGANVNWEMNRNTGVLKITGKGPMKDFFKFGAPWYQGGHGDYIKEVIIGDGVTTIGDYCTWGCSNITKITIGKDVKAIRFESFATLHQLTSVVIPGNVKLIGGGAFERCDALKTVTIGKGVETIGSEAFSGCSSLTSIVIPDSVKVIEEPGAFKGCKSLKSVVIGNGITTIGESTFAGCTSLSSVKFGANVKDIGQLAFANCNSLKKVVIPNGVVRVINSFRWCKGLESVTIADSVTEIDAAFMDCTALKTVNFGKGLSRISTNAFNGCSALKRMVIPETVTTIGEKAFLGCSSLEYLSISDSVTKVEPYAFAGCTSLRSIDFGSGLKNLGNQMFYDCRGLTCVAIPGTVEGVGYQSFRQCTSLESVSIGDGVKVIGGEAFASCGLKYINIPESVTLISAGAFEYDQKLNEVYYGGDEDQWKKVEIMTRNDPLNRAKLHFDSVANPFRDVPYGKWFTSAALYCAENGLMSGTAYNVFAPEKNLTRAMFVTVLAKIDNADLSSYTGTSFTDVQEGKWYSKPIEWASRNGYTSGVGGGLFGVDRPVTREELARFLYTYSEKKEYDISKEAELQSYEDADAISSWAREAVSWAVGSGLISGTSKTTVSPKDPATRAQVALIIMNYINGLEK